MKFVTKHIFIGLFFACLHSPILLWSQQQDPATFPNFQWDSIVNLSVPKVKLLWEIGISANTYQGDLSAYGNQWASSFQTSLTFRKKRRINSRLALGAGFMTGESGNFDLFIAPTTSTTTTPQANTYFRTSLIHLHYELIINLWKTRRFFVYLSQGIGLIRFEPRDQNGGNLQAQRATRARGEEYGNTSVCFPTGLGIGYLLRNGYGIGIQSVWMNPLTDYLDNISRLGRTAGNDNVWTTKVMIFIPLQKSLSLQPPKKSKEQVH
ncbi:MAG TPA: hypothetical protein DCM08_09945 [Microscillaceae bacterium]|jgi:hypothetical protein|nr:hypothetical protein [Microscillaceae bacterium]